MRRYLVGIVLSKVRPGTYKHYKGKFYEVVGVAKHSETMEELVTYYCLYPNKSGQLWVRPLAMFEEMVELDGKLVLRFELIENNEEVVS